MTKRDKFPVFVDTADKKAVVIGGGKIAQRRIATLLKFDIDITVVSPDITEWIKQNLSDITYINDVYKREYISGAWLVSACTDSRDTNRQIGIDAKAENILVSVCDRKEECNCYFPGVVTGENVTIGICGDGKNHRDTKMVIDKIRNMFKREKS